MSKSKNIVINVPAEKTRTSTGIVEDKDKIKDSLQSYVHIKNQKLREMLIPGKTYVRYINKKDKGLRIGGFVKQVSNDAIMLSKNGRTWPVQFKSNNVYAKVSGLYENMEKAHVLNHLFDNVAEKKMRVQNLENGKWVTLSWDEFIQTYCDKYYL